MIYQCYFELSQKDMLFTNKPYVGFGLYDSVNPTISLNCPELASRYNQRQLSEYAAMLHMWRNPKYDQDDWIGFTSYRQLEKSPTYFSDRQAVEQHLRDVDVVAWGAIRFVDVNNRFVVNLASQGESCHPGITECLAQLLRAQGARIPIQYFVENTGLYCNYWAMSKKRFNEFMEWSFPMVRLCLEDPPAYVRSHPRAIAYIVERLFVLWYMSRSLKCQIVTSLKEQFINLLPMVDQRIELVNWNVNLAEICSHHRFRPKGIIHVGAHYGQEADFYEQIGVAKVLWIEADPKNMPGLRANIGNRSGHHAIQACLSDSSSESVAFFRTSNRGESSSILPMLHHLVVHPEIAVVEETRTATTTFQQLILETGVELDEYDTLVLDVQGAELKVLRGMGDSLEKFNGVYLEVNQMELYEGCAMLPDVDSFLSERGFQRVETLLTTRAYGDAFYVRKSTLSIDERGIEDTTQSWRETVEHQRSFSLHVLGGELCKLELLCFGEIARLSSPHIRRWQIRIFGNDIVLEFLGDSGRTVVLEPGLDGIWRGHSPIAPSSRLQLIPGNMAEGRSAAGFPHRTNLPLSLVTSLKAFHSIDCFVESGTFQGTTTKLMADHFKKLVTIEADRSLFLETSQRLANIAHVECLYGDSGVVIPELLRRISGAAIFWLDAHWCGEGTALVGSECPIIRELEAILLEPHDHVILIDDARLFLSPPGAPHRTEDWPNFTAICDLVAKHRERPFIVLLEDVIYIGPWESSELVLDYLRTVSSVSKPLSIRYGWGS